jgi:hypothetical protein
MSSIKELNVKKFLKNQTRGSIVRFNVTRNLVYQTVKCYKKTGCIEKHKYSTLKTANLHSSYHQYNMQAY